MRTTLLLWTVLAATSARAEFGVSLSTPDKEIGTEDLLELRVDVKEAPVGMAIDWPKSKDFTMISRTSHFNSGKDKAEVRFFRPAKAGTFIFPAVVVNTPSGKHQTAPLNVVVSKGHFASGIRANDNRKTPLAPGVPDGAKDYFLRAQLGPSESVLGDALDLKLTLFVRKDLQVSEVDKIAFDLPDYAIIERRPDVFAKPETVSRDGVDYRAVLLRMGWAMALKVGSSTPAAASAEVIVAGQRHKVSAAVPQLVVNAADDARRSFTMEEAVALIPRKLGPMDLINLKNGPNQFPVNLKVE